MGDPQQHGVHPNSIALPTAYRFPIYPGIISVDSKTSLTAESIVYAQIISDVPK